MKYFISTVRRILVQSIHEEDMIINYSDPIVITGANGFIGPQVIKALLEYGFMNLRCFVRPSGNLIALKKVINSCNDRKATIEIIVGDLLSQEDCDKLTEGAHVVYHLAADMRNTSFESSYVNNVITTQNLLNGVSQHSCLQRFVNVSSMRVYSNLKLKRGELLNETCEIETDLVNGDDAYCNAKVKQEDLVAEYCKKHKLSFVTLRPGVVYGPGHEGLHRMIGRWFKIGVVGVFIHLGGSQYNSFILY